MVGVVWLWCGWCGVVVVWCGRVDGCGADSLVVFLTGRVEWGKVGETERELGQQVQKKGRDKEAVDSLISELGLGSSKQSRVGIKACNKEITNVFDISVEPRVSVSMTVSFTTTQGSKVSVCHAVRCQMLNVDPWDILQYLKIW